MSVVGKGAMALNIMVLGAGAWGTALAVAAASHAGAGHQVQLWVRNAVQAAQMQATREHDYYLKLFRQCGGVMQSIVNFPVPVIAKVAGIATAAGCQLVASCDLAVAADTAKFAVSGINVGLFCSTPAVALSRNVAAKKAFEMLITGEFISAQLAEQHGLINRTVPAHELDAAVAALTDSICEKSPVAVRTGKAMFHRQRGMALDAAYDFAAQTMARNMMAEDVYEGIDAFIHKRKPEWKGR